MARFKPLSVYPLIIVQPIVVLFLNTTCGTCCETIFNWTNRVSVLETYEHDHT